MRLDTIPLPPLPPAAAGDPPLPSLRRGGRRRARPVDPSLLVVLEQTVVAVFAIERAALRREARGAARLALARQVAMYLGHVVCGLSLSDVGRLLGRDRTTVAHACARIEGLRDDPAFDRALGLLERTVRVLAGPEEGACAI